MTSDHQPAPRLAPPAVRFAALVVLVAGLGLVMLLAGPDRAHLTALISRSPVLAPVTAVLASALLVPALAPRTVLAAVGGALFGAAAGTAYVLAGVTLGATVAFGVGRVLGRDFVAPRLRGRMGLVEAAVTRHGLLAVIVMRLIPLVPFGLANYAFGTTGVRRRQFVLGTLVGAAPATLAYALLGAAAMRRDATSMAVATAVVVTLGVAGSIGTVLVWRRRPRRVPEAG